MKLDKVRLYIIKTLTGNQEVPVSEKQMQMVFLVQLHF